jgi:myo-inositol 2-dehydrogenase/D-chiro-inositol 1-dehydrogenase
LKIGIIGCGKQAPKHISGLAKLPGVELVLADSRPEAAERLGRESKLPWVRDVQAIFADPDISAVDICTPTSSHLSLIQNALVSGKHFFCEKPLCEREEEEVRLIDRLLAEHRLVGMIGYVYRFAPVFELGQRLFKDVPRTGESLELGRVVTAFFRIGGRGSHQAWKHLKAHGGGAINEMLVHMLDLALWYFGPASEASVLTKGLLRPKRVINGMEETVDAEDYVIARLQMKSGVEVICQADLLTPAFTQFVEVQGENGTFMGSIQPDMPSFLHLDKGVAGYQAGKTTLNFGPRNLFEAQMAEFVQAVRAQTPPERCTIQDSLELMKTMEKLQERS